MKKTLIFFALSLLFLVGFNAQAGNKKEKPAKKPEKPLFESEMDSLSYAFGINIGTWFNGQLKQYCNNKENNDLLFNGFKTGVKGEKTLMSNEVAEAYIQQYIKKFQEKLVAERKEKSATFLKENAKEEGVISLPSGLQYKILTQGNGEKPTTESQVKVHYEGKLIDGSIFDSSIERGEATTLTLNRVIPGWTEALQLMPVGSKWRLFIPYNLGYGEQGAGEKIPPYSTLIFDVQLIEIVK